MSGKKKLGGRRGGTIDGKPNPIDVHVGRRLRQRRALLGMSQQALAGGIALSFQQVQKYEKGSNRLSPSRMVDIARILDVPVSYFYDEMPADVARNGQNAMHGQPTMTNEVRADDLHRRETLELVRAYYKITDHKVRKRLFEMAKAIAANGK